MLNWYITAKNALLSCKWIDPNGHVYNAFLSHENWIEKNKDILREQYNIDISDSVTVDSFETLIDNGWIRMLQDYDDLVFTVKDFSDRELKNIQDFIFSHYSNADVRNVWISDDSKNIKFKWQDYVKEGISFIDFVQSLTISKGGF
jgi:hypothetical protein